LDRHFASQAGRRGGGIINESIRKLLSILLPDAVPAPSAPASRAPLFSDQSNDDDEGAALDEDAELADADEFLDKVIEVRQLDIRLEWCAFPLVCGEKMLSPRVVFSSYRHVAHCVLHQKNGSAHLYVAVKRQLRQESAAQGAPADELDRVSRERP
jgi:hypothetical protein